MNCMLDTSRNIPKEMLTICTQLLCHGAYTFLQDNISYYTVTCKLGTLNCLYFWELYMRSQQSGTGTMHNWWFVSSYQAKSFIHCLTKPVRIIHLEVHSRSVNIRKDGIFQAINQAVLKSHIEPLNFTFNMCYVVKAKHRCRQVPS